MDLRTTFTVLAVFVAPFLANSVAHAHGSMRPEHGGIVQMGGEIVFELVVSRAGVELYISEDDEPLSSSDMTARLTITRGGASTQAPLAPANGNKFVAAGLNIPRGSTVTVMLQNNASGARTFATFAVG